MKNLLLFSLLFLSWALKGQVSHQINFKFLDQANNQPISNLLVKYQSTTAYSNSDGFVSVFMQSDTCTFRFYESDVYLQEYKLKAYNDTFIVLKIERIYEISKFKLRVNHQPITAKNNRISIGQNTLQSISLPLSTNDPIHLLKTLPGVNTSQEMNANLNIRGGSAYNTVFYLDNIPVPNLTHSFGLYSFFDLNTIRQIDYFNNNVSSEYGSRGSSYIKFYLKDPISNKSTSELNINPFFVSGNVNLKLKKEKLGVFVNYRKSIFNTEYNVLFPLFSEFSDLLIKTKYNFNKRSSLSLIYTDNQDRVTDFNATGINSRDSLQWQFKAFSSQFDLISKSGIKHEAVFFIKNQVLSRQSLNNQFNYKNEFNEMNFKYSLKKNFSQNFKSSLGLEHQIHQNNNSLSFNNKIIDNLNVLSLYTDNAYQFKNFIFNANLRLSNFIDLNKTYLEKRLSINYKLKKSNFIAEYNTFVNATHSLVNNVFPVPDDFKFLANKDFLPQVTNEWLIGYNVQLKKSNLQLNAYHRNFLNSYDYRRLNIDNYASFSNVFKMNHVSYGVEALSNININEKHSFVLSYTLSKSTMQNDSVNLGLLYPTSYDRPHNFNLLYSFKYKRFTFTSTFTWQSGRVATVPLFVAYANATPIYSLRNEYRLKPFHKMDIGFQYSFRNKGKVKQFLNVNLYNVYSRKNTYAVIWGDINNTRIPEFKYLTAFPILPSFSYSIKF
jgi:hypothetical protein